jgi:polysaccharide export outer membrane protein
MYNIKKNPLATLILCMLILSSCAGTKKVAYLQKLDNSINQLQKNNDTQFDARIKPKDLLSITVVSSEPMASKGFNLVMPQIAELSNANSLYSQPTLQTYLVDNDGKIDFPVFGKLFVKGYTRKELEGLLQSKLASSFSKERPVVTIRFINYAVNILGEVNRPGKYNVSNDRISIFDALAMAGDMTIYGKRENVKVIRENADGTKTILTLNLNDEKIIYSSAYYLEQNDVLYIEPNKTKSNATNFGAAETYAISAVSVLLSLTSLIVNIVK